MVTTAASRPAQLTQSQIEDLAGGRHAGLASVLHIARSEPPADARAAAVGSSPVAVSVQEMKLIARSAAVPPTVAKRISAASPPEVAAGKSKSKGKGKAKPAGTTTAAKDAGSKPSLKPQPPRTDDPSPF